jgi:predicted RND superfamily exporter protein
MATAFRRTLAETGAGIAAASITTAVAFFALMLARVRGMRELGLICGVGMILTLVTTLVMLPALVALVARVRPTREKDRGMSGFGLAPLTRSVVRHHRVYGAGLTLLTVALLGVLLLPALQGRPYLNDDFRQFRPDDSPAIRLDEELEERMGARLRSFKVVLRDEDSGRLLDRTARVTEALAGREDLALVQSATGLVPPPAVQSRVLEGIRGLREADASALDPERVSRTLVEALRSASGRPPGPAYLQSVERARAALAVEDHLSLETLLDSPLGPLLRRFVSRGLGSRPHEFSSVVYVNPSSEVKPEQALDRVIETLAEVDSGARVVGMKALGRVIKGQVRRDLALTTGVAFLGVLVCLSVTFRRPVLVALTTLPVICGLVWSLGLLLLLTGEPFSLIGVSVIPLILGIGIDDGIHIVHRFHLHRGEGLARIFHHTGRAIAITSLTTMAAFGSLALADYGGLRASGQMAGLGILACLIASVVFLPALLTAVSRRQGP